MLFWGYTLLVETGDSRRSHRAFTLIELLVVIGIIVILAAILFPVFTQAKRSAKEAVRLSNIRQVGLALTLYAGDYDDLPPYATDFDVAAARLGYPGTLNLECDAVKGTQTLTDVLFSYTQNRSLFIAEDDPGKRQPWATPILEKFTSFDHDCLAAANQKPLSVMFRDDKRSILADGYTYMDALVTYPAPERKTRKWNCIWADTSVSKVTRGICHSYFNQDYP
ncbi:MAG: type II secretion system GspH family protein [Armatimonadetes bacterium]|nr:type II secretion system GspH family protein [Armatimonadota bacterium]